jgi:hypothetical protein
MKFPWSKGEGCKHLVKYQDTNIEIAGVSVPNIFSLGNVSINPKVLQAAEKALQYLDINHFQNCETLKQVPDEDSKKKYFDQMAKQQQKLNDIAMAIAAYSTNTNSQKLDETLSKIFESNLELPKSEDEAVKKTLKIHISQEGVKASGIVSGGKVEINNMTNGEINAPQKDIESGGDVNGPTVKIG